MVNAGEDWYMVAENVGHSVGACKARRRTIEKGKSRLQGTSRKQRQTNNDLTLNDILFFCVIYYRNQVPLHTAVVLRVKWSRTLMRPKKDRVALGKEDLLYVREHEYPRYLEINIFDDSNNGSKVTRPRATCEILLRLATLIGPKLIPLAR
ncbi:hypothetical protein BC941DRAFT_477112 [Chlamydoabsidia padenii]|nr:hypothetical protein BC941DRAFT_477112 [Chlamydoabsidia padenii]